MGWKRFNKYLITTWPRRSGWYQCTVEINGQMRTVMDLYWCKPDKRFKDDRRQDVFDKYDVMVDKYDEKVGDYSEVIFNDALCDRTDDVVAWRPMVEPYMKGFVKKEN